MTTTTTARDTLEARATLKPGSYALFNVILSAYMDGLETGAQMNACTEGATDDKKKEA